MEQPGKTLVTDWPGTVSEREAELRAVMAMASHDLKSPLTSVVARVDLLRTDYSTLLGEEFEQAIAAIERGLHRMTRMTEELLGFAAAGHTLDMTVVPLQPMINEMSADHGIDIDGTLPDVFGDADLLRRVLDNLVGNAVKYTPVDKPPQIRVSAHSRPDGTVRIEVADRGIGIPIDDQSRVFDPFHRCANRDGRPGTGLGLAICKRIIERHGGHIGVDENPGGGSRFWFTVPAW
ncbi:HAMP domain-containing sensor histidine kinase [Actinoplanes oblitus]|uniref:Sensor-like histidine kinase SenX3 n=1 Tax=Actinoplanes oblitus TaxID=3040509 RepID=A0ABY8WQM5_9ACTN|nr:HAMP domain-containing sensor histidine kinase [Actinoplanes oblitus]WIM99953.1 HAMP domain-containing sensor histidine kinase [Actinoplanes oblitus]